MELRGDFNVSKILTIGILLVIYFATTTYGQSCQTIDSCTCEMSDGSGRVNLHGLAIGENSNGEAAFSLQGNDGWKYKYNPCNAFQFNSLTDLAILQTNKAESNGYDLGVQASASFNYSAQSGLSVEYQANTGTRISRVILICDPAVNAHRFNFIGELISLEYDFELTTPCACPGLCDDAGPVSPLPTLPPQTTPPSISCNLIDSCTCEMSDGSGRVNLRSTALIGSDLHDSAFTVGSSGIYWYKFNPCNGFSPIDDSLSDLAVLQTLDSAGTTGYDLGNQASADFQYVPGSGLSIHYKSTDGSRNSRVLLNCVHDTSLHNFAFVGELVSYEYDFIFSSPCACPGACDNNGVIGGLTCSPIDSCTCEMSDGSGRVNLHGLAVDGNSNGEAAFTVVDNWTYKYNPCNGFQLQSLADLAIVQTNALETVGYDLGVQSSVVYDYTISAGLAIRYQANVEGRKSRILLICDPSVNAHSFGFIGELVSLEYDFTLTTPCACPGVCDNDGPINPLPTLPPTGGNPTCTGVDSCTCIMSDGSGQVNLHSAALEGTNLNDAAFTVYGGDGYWYKFNPCNGFSPVDGSLTDLAILQAIDSAGSSGYDLGTQTSANFNYDQSKGLSIQFISSGSVRNSRVLLKCLHGPTGHKLEFVGELTSLEYDFIFSSPCACPGACDDDGVIAPPSGSDNTCNFIDSCTCEMSDGSGRINLHSLESQGPEVYAFAVDDGKWYYKYNPCGGFSFSSLNNLALVQTNSAETEAYDLGVQSSTTFNYSDSSGLSIRYKSTDGIRQSRVLLICEPNVNVNVFELVGELVRLEYDFILSSPCACPGVCDNNGPIIPLPSPSPPGFNGATCNYIDSCTCEMSDGSGRVNLHSAALDPTITTAGFIVLGDDNWHYHYNPCTGFSTGAYTDLAILQTAGEFATWGYDLGVQSKVSFNTSDSSGLTLRYTSLDSARTSRMLLICTPGTNEHKMQFIGELVTLEYDFTFASPCACPGACDDNGVISPGPATTPGIGYYCSFVDSCTCDMSDGSGRVNLHSLSLQGGVLTDSAFTTFGSDGWYYKYNPCTGFAMFTYTDLALLQVSETGDRGYDVGVQTTAAFDYSLSSGLTVKYQSADGVRTGRVLLICQPSLNQNTFQFVGELVTLEYDFILTSPCACPGMCDNDGPTVPLPTPTPTPNPGGNTDVSCDFVDSCTCEMSDGSGRVNLHGPALEGTNLIDGAFTVFGDGWYYKYNPCNGFSANGFTDLAVYQTSDSSGTWGFDLGTQSSAYFNNTQSNGLTIHYSSADAARNSRVLLICQPGATEHKLEYIGELVITEYDFVFTSPCACPGACDDNGIIGGPASPTPTPISCSFVDSCTCDMSDGTGRVNLHSLALEAVGGQELTDAAFAVYGSDGYNYKYNPCIGFSFFSYTDLALVQVGGSGNAAYDVGVQSSAQFNYQESSGLSIHYDSAAQYRSGRVLLVCQPNLNAHTFQFVGELITLEYDFILTSPCACPGTCNDYGPIVPLPTPPPGSGNDATCRFIDSCTCVMTDGSGHINLHGPAAEGALLRDGAFTVFGNDGWYYKYNPCNGFSSGGFTDLAVYQTGDTSGTSGYDLGVQSSTYFNYTQSSGLSIHYTALDALRASRVLLICTPGTTEHKFEFIGELIITEYDFLFSSPCACLGACDDNGLINGPAPTPPTPPPSSLSCSLVDSCTCDMSDGSGRINLRSLALEVSSGQVLTDAAFTVLGYDGYYYKYNPCNGFTVLSYSDLAIAQISQDGTAAFDVGVQSTADFVYSQSSGLSIHYDSASPYRTGRVLLVCQPNLNANTFEFVGELVALEYDFILSTPCACPGLCDDNGPTVPLPTPLPTGSTGATCNFVDSCTCEMSDGSGRVNLHGPALEGNNLYDGAFSVYGYDGWYYKYNPCNGFSSGGYNNLAVLQSGDISGSWGFDLGVQPSAEFSYTQSNGLSIQYTALDLARTSRVLLVCAPGTTNHKFEFIGELVITEYDFLFTSPCACPGACDDNGVIGGPATPTPSSISCSYVDSCICDMTDGTGQVNLRSLALQGGTSYEAAFSVIGYDGWQYKYNPCDGFNFQAYTDLAIVQTSQDEGYGFDLGVQSKASFLYQLTDSTHYSLSIQYRAADSLRVSRVLLVCQPGLNQNTFEFVGELVVTEYDFILSTPCACPGLCDDNGPTTPLPTPSSSPNPGATCNYVDSCTCEMSDGSGRINLHGPALEGTYLYDAAFNVYGNDGWYYRYNPCNGFLLGGYSDLAVYQSDYYGSSGYDLGIQSSAYFDYTPSNGLSIHYSAADSLRNSRILLICAPGTTDHKLEFIGELVTTEYDFVFTSPCACPGACDDNGIIGGPASPPPGTDVCTFVDSCTCDMSDGSGKINLHSLSREGTVLYNSAFSVDAPDGWTYKYNPCNGFSFASYSDLALLQTDQLNIFSYDLGVQSSAVFGYTQSSGVSIYYTSLDGIRTSRVLLICQQYLNSNVFEFVGELVILEYDFILTSPCACPGLCDDDGPIIPLPTPTPGTGGGRTCNFVDSCTCEMSDGSGKINLHGPALEGTSLYDSAFTVYGNDGWYYKYNPCNGYYLGGFYDLAVFQSSDTYGSYGYDLGVQNSAAFQHDESNGVSIHYIAADSQRTSRILLVCAPGTTQHNFEFVGELITTEYDFVFTSPCACAGACDDGGLIQTSPPPGTDVCQYVDSCTCEMKDGTGQVNLHSLAMEPTNGYLSESAFSVLGADSWTYKYNPCNGFSFYVYSDLAIAQSDVSGYSGYDLGVQSKVYFSYEDTKGLSILYESGDGVRHSRVLLVCQSQVNSNVFEFVGELAITEYDFILSSPCACPGVCDENGPIITLPTLPPGGTGDKTCNLIDSCTCEMSDGTGQINLNSLSLGDYYLYDSAFTELGSDGYYYKYNPCIGFYFLGTSDTAVAQSSDINGYGYGNVLGVQSSAKFSYDDSSGVTISYISNDNLRSSRVLLLCEPNTNSHKFQYIGQLTTFEYEFYLTSPCACPGGCDDNGLVQPPPSQTYCTKLDSCSCEMNDGTGRVNLRSIGLKGDSLTEAAFTADGLDGWLYKYNPCTEFSLLYYDNLAVAQVNSFGTTGHDLGVQDSADFQYSSTSGLSIYYTSGDTYRTSKVLLVCDPYAMQAQLEFIGELVTLEYDFLLKSVCACPGGCTDFGPVNPIITQAPQGGGGVGDLPDTVNVYVNQTGDHDPSYYFWPDVGGSSIALIFHDILIILLIAAIIFLVKNVRFCRNQAVRAKQQMNYAHLKDIVTTEETV